MVRYNYLVPIVAKPCFTFSYLGVSFIDFQKEKTPQSLGLTVIRNEITYQLLADGFRVHTKLPSDS